MFQPNVTVLVQVWTEQSRYIRYLIEQEAKYMSKARKVRRDFLLSLLLVDTLLIAIYITIIVLKVSFSFNRDPLYRRIYRRMSQGQRIVYRFRPLTNITWCWPWREILAVAAIVLIINFLRFQLKVIRHMLIILCDRSQLEDYSNLHAIRI